MHFKILFDFVFSECLAYVYVCLLCVFLVLLEERRKHWNPWNCCQIVMSTHVGARS